MKLDDEYRIASLDATKLRWYVVALDETTFWRLDKLEQRLREQLGRFEPTWLPSVKAKYVSSPDVGVHICSFQRSAEAFYIESFPAWSHDVPDEVVEIASEFLIEHDSSEPVAYFDHSSFFRGIDGVAGENYRFIGSSPVEDDGHLDAIIEYERGNPSL